MSPTAEGEGRQHRRRGLWEMTPELFLLLLALTATQTGKALCEDETVTDYNEGSDNGAEDGTNEYTFTSITTLTPTVDATETWSTLGDDNPPSGSGDEIAINPGDDVSTEVPVDPDYDAEDTGLVIIIIPVVLVLVIICMIVGAVLLKYRWRTKALSTDQEDPYLDDDGEKVPMPMFEDDVPSVQELEMEDLEKWMIKDDGRIKMESDQK